MSRLRIAAPVVLIVAALVAAGVAATVHENSTNGTAPPRHDGRGGPRRRRSGVPLTYAAAAKLGKTGAYDWGPSATTRRGA